MGTVPNRKKVVKVDINVVNRSIPAKTETKLGIPASFLTQTAKLMNEDNLKQILYILIAVRVTIPPFFLQV